ncbi:metallophosphoesterase [Shimia sp. MIT910701]
MLSNQALKIERHGVWLAGLEDQIAIRRNGKWQGLDDLPGTLSQIADDGAPVVMMAHEPDIFSEMPNRVSLTVSGHTHGGQVRLFGWSPIVPSRHGNRFAYGHVREHGRDLVVSGGIGCSIMPVRFGVVPEITVIEVSS